VSWLLSWLLPWRVLNDEPEPPALLADVLDLGIPVVGSSGAAQNRRRRSPISWDG
jgi:hypothetical protein